VERARPGGPVVLGVPAERAQHLPRLAEGVPAAEVEQLLAEAGLTGRDLPAEVAGLLDAG